MNYSKGNKTQNLAVSSFIPTSVLFIIYHAAIYQFLRFFLSVIDLEIEYSFTKEIVICAVRSGNFNFFENFTFYLQCCLLDTCSLNWTHWLSHPNCPCEFFIDCSSSQWAKLSLLFASLSVSFIWSVSVFSCGLWASKSLSFPNRATVKVSSATLL